MIQPYNLSDNLSTLNSLNHSVVQYHSLSRAPLGLGKTSPHFHVGTDRPEQTRLIIVAIFVAHINFDAPA